MFCGNCGVENSSDAKFCRECGNTLDNFENNVSNEEKVQIGKLLKKIPLKIALGLAAVVMVLIVVICVSLNSGKTIKLDKYLTVEVDGYNEFGTAKVSVDWDEIEEKYGSKISFTNTARKRYGGLLSMMTPMETLKNSVNVKIDKTNELSNGDVIEYTWEISDELTDILNCKVEFEDGEYEVSDLEEIEKFDAFSDLKVEFSGISPNGKVSFDYQGEELEKNVFSCDKVNGLKNEDTVTISINGKDMAYYAENLGKIPEKTSKTYTVSGLQEYAQKYDDLSEDFISEVNSEAEDTIKAYVASNYKTDTSLSDFKYEGYIMNNVKDASGYVKSYNNLIIVYSGTVSNSDGKFQTTKVYYPVRFINVLIGDTITYEENAGILGYTDLATITYHTKGYIDGNEMYSKIVTANRDSYISEVSKELQHFEQTNE